MTFSQPLTRTLSSGLVHLTRLHTIERPSNASNATSTVSFDLSDHSEDKNWSWTHLRNEFQAKDSEKLFEKYQVRIQHNFFMVLLILNVFFNAVAIVVYFNADSESFPGPVIMRSASLVVYVGFFVLACIDEQWLRPTFARIIASITVLIAMLFSEHGGALYAFTEKDALFSLQKIRPTYYLIITNHVFLPFPTRIYSAASTLVIMIVEIYLTAHTRYTSTCPTNAVYRYAIADFIFYSVTAAIGYILTYLLEIANRRAFLDHRRCVQSKFSLEYKQEQQDKLLGSCLPLHLCERVRNDIKIVMASIQKHQKVPPRPFNELYVEKYKNVSILYADIVNSMLLANKLSPQELVETLNELFGRFDETADKYNCLRIKLLGDCYYCVSGVPNFDENHVWNCVQMGLDIIQIIKSVQIEREVDVNMRIGIHSGMVLSGMLGLHKWQYDIWSQDSMKASAMEHDGVAGYVHISQTSFSLLTAQQLSELVVQEHNDSTGEATFILTRDPSLFRTRSDTNSPLARRRGHSEKLKRSIRGLRRSSSLDSIPFTKRVNNSFEPSLKKKEMIRLVNEVMDKDIETMPLSKQSQWLHPKGINPLILNFTDNFLIDQDTNETIWMHERKYARLICLGIILIKFLVSEDLHFSLRLKSCLAFSSLIIILALIISYIKPSLFNYGVRVCSWLLISSSLIMCSAIDIIKDDCTNNMNSETLANCAFTWYYTICLILSMTSTSLFLRINLWLKFSLHILTSLIFFFLSENSCSVLSILDKKFSEWKFLGYSPDVGHLYYISIVAILLHFIDRQIEYILRLDYQWKTKLDSERKKTEMVGNINSILLENILPIHVAQRYLNSSLAHDHLYNESYDSIAVMFAALPNYIDFYTETNINEEGLKCLLLLNEIICDFDKVVDSRSFSRIEKIKTIGSTYMSASGLQPGRASADSNISAEDASTNVITLVNFAIALMETIQRINKDALQDFHLRIGIAVGPVIAGIVGAAKPQYDIWGDTVNVSSRMESTGVTGRIQVTEGVAEIVKKAGFEVECRGPIMVKGKGQITTYLIKTPFDSSDILLTKM